MASVDQLKAALIQAHNAGDTEAANMFASKIKQMQGGQQNVAPTGDLPSTSVELQDVAEPPRSFGGRLLDGYIGVAKEVGGNIEALGTLATGIAAEPLSGLYGAGVSAVSGLDAGADAVKSAKEAMTYVPRGREGSERLEQIGEIAEYIPDVSGGAGDAVFGVTGSPAAATTAVAAVTLIPELLGVGALRKVRSGTRLIDDAGAPTKALRKALDKEGLSFGNLSDTAKQKIPRTANQSSFSKESLIPDSVQDALREQIVSGGRDDALAGLKVSGGSVVPDAMGVEALRQGYSPGVVQTAKTASSQTKKRMMDMLNITRRVKGSSRASLDVRPGDVVGDAVTDRVKHIRASADLARKELNDMARSKLKGQEIDGNIIRDQLQESMDGLDVSLSVKDDGKIVPKFKKSIISKDKSSQVAIRDAIDLIDGGGPIDALEAHKIKRQLDNIIDFRQQSSKGLGKDGRDVLKALRSSLNESIRVVNDDYARVNDVMSSALGALDDFNKASGSAVNIFGKGANSAIGTKARSLTSNIQSRVQFENSINNLDRVAGELGGEFGDNIKDLAFFANAMDARFGTVAKNSLTSEVESAINRALTGGVSQEILQQGASKAAGAANKIRGIDEFHAFEAIDDILRRTK